MKRRSKLLTVLDPAKAGRLARERFSSAFMSDAKWRKLLTAIIDSDLQVSEMVVKFIDVEEPQLMRFPPNLDCHYAYMDTIEFGPVELRAIEWLDLPADADFLVRPLGQFPTEATTQGTRIIGYRA